VGFLQGWEEPEVFVQDQPTQGYMFSSGTVDIATLALTNGVNLAADTPKAITLSTSAADLLVAKGDVLTFRQVKVGNGMNVPDMHGEVEYELQ
jgi:hypothetical protein